ncbi:single-stranded DNA-binding protein [Eubacterium sp. 1001713B170207_170306_E7]|uniref:single-stranded DNA-binding protein n=1 Tax=Eubacterium sp. 1001713B170207_170306_E7 TaxID=2787097 RepID=UPI00189C48C2|nr:single-stranded DNA-binding protein [Eubacterium sp. 1001713B170207_170306_E7]
MDTYNEVKLSGEIITDIELHTSNAGKKLCNFSLALEKEEEKGHSSNFEMVVPICAMEETAEELIEKAQKGNHLIVTNGEISVGSYVTGKEKRFVTTILVRNFKILY